MEYSAVALQQVRERRLLINQVDLWLYEEMAPYIGQRVLEVGCGMGNFACHLTDRELYVGIDICEESVAHVRKTYRSHSNMQAYVVDATGIELGQLAHFGFDTVVSLNVLEHVEQDEAVLRNVSTLLQSGGRAVVVVPAHRVLYGAMDRAIGHYRRYNKHAMNTTMARAGLTCVAQKYLNALGALGWFVSGRVLGHQVPPSGQLSLFNLVTPLLKYGERRVAMPFGISLLTVAQKCP